MIIGDYPKEERQHTIPERCWCGKLHWYKENLTVKATITHDPSEIKQALQQGFVVLVVASLNEIWQVKEVVELPYGKFGMVIDKPGLAYKRDMQLYEHYRDYCVVMSD